LIPSWNKGCENTPEMQVQAGDCIVAVNGVFGNTDLMRAELKSTIICLTVKRGQLATGAPAAEVPPAAVPVVDAPATEEKPLDVTAEAALAVDAPAVAEAAVTEAIGSRPPKKLRSLASTSCLEEAPAAEAPADASVGEVTETQPPNQYWTHPSIGGDQPSPTGPRHQIDNLLEDTATESPTNANRAKAPRFIGGDRPTFNGAPERAFSVESAEKGTSAKEDQLCNIGRWC